MGAYFSSEAGTEVASTEPKFNVTFSDGISRALEPQPLVVESESDPAVGLIFSAFNYNSGSNEMDDLQSEVSDLERKLTELQERNAKELSHEDNLLLCLQKRSEILTRKITNY